MDGGTGEAYCSVPLGGTIPADGYFVIAHPAVEGAANATNPALRDAADLFAEASDLQNGPDAVLLLDPAGEVADALAYGEFAAGQATAGEGAPATGVAPGSSLTRDFRHTDLDDNRTDFLESSLPTPGGPPADPCQPSFCQEPGETVCVALADDYRCECAADHVRAPDGLCLPVDPSLCDPACAGVDEVCAGLAAPGICLCKPGTHRDDADDCVPD